jgi:hypothetical protein
MERLSDAAIANFDSLSSSIYAAVAHAHALPFDYWHLPRILVRSEGDMWLQIRWRFAVSQIAIFSVCKHAEMKVRP